MITIRALYSNHIRTYLQKLFIMINSLLLTFCLIQFLIHLTDVCVMLFYMYYTCLFFILTISHLMMVKLPKLNVELYEISLRRILVCFGLFWTTYLFCAVMFWQKSDINPAYCTLCIYYSFPTPIGILIAVHCFYSIIIYANLIHCYITRRYYLLAIGGYQVQQRRLQQIEEINNRQPILQPDYNIYALPVGSNTQGKYYQFEDVDEGVQLPQKFICSICLNEKVQRKHSKSIEQLQIQHQSKPNREIKQVQNRSRQQRVQLPDAGRKIIKQQNELCNMELEVVITPCKHFFHKSCIQNWVRVTPKCPDCRMSLNSVLK